MTHVQYEPAVTALAGLLDEFRNRRIVALSAEKAGMVRHTSALSAQWNDRFPGFPTAHFPYTSFRGEHYRKHRDAHLKDIIVGSLADRGGETTIVNPACVFGVHAYDLATRLPRAEVIGTDIDPNWHRVYRLLKLGRLPPNFAFLKDDIFAPQLNVQPTAVVFFGACGSVSDGAPDYAIASGASYVACRTCCHDNIGGNVTVTARPGQVNRFFRFKNWILDRMKAMPTYSGFYFSLRYTPGAYPRSAAARNLSTSDEFLAVARDSVDSDICRAIIDLDRYLHLAEHGFRVEYQGELLVAEVVSPPSSRSSLPASLRGPRLKARGPRLRAQARHRYYQSIITQLSNFPMRSDRAIIGGMTGWSRAVAGDPRFQHAVLSLIVLNAVVMGLETSPALASAYAPAFWWFHALVQAAFVFEMSIRLAAHGARPAAFFRDGWNTFDFAVVAAALVPAVGPLATIARLARILRIARLVSTVPELRLIVGTMLRSIPAMGHVLMLLGLLMYGYGIVGVSLFGSHDPARWGSLGRALMTLFEVMTLEGWVEMMEASLAASPWAWIFYVSFIVVTVFIVVNLFIAVVINNLDATKAAEAAAAQPAPDLAGRLRLLKEELAALEAHVRQGRIGS